MAAKTSIEWTRGADGTAGASWNPIIATTEPSMPTGPRIRGWHCVHVSDGCKNCYAETLNKRLGTGLPYAAQQTRNVNIALAQGGQSGIGWPLRSRKPKRIFVCSMTDLFGEWVPDEFIDQVFAVMALSPQHTFLVLTKRAERMRKYLNKPQTQFMVPWHADRMSPFIGDPNKMQIRIIRWPLSNVWLGVSVEDQKTADERIPHLLRTPAKLRWVSYEPALGPIDFMPLGDLGDAGINWVVVGGESGPGARPFDLAWARQAVEQCREEQVACFVKQIGARPVITTRDHCTVPYTGPESRKGNDPAEWPEDIRVRQYPGGAK